MADIAMCLNHTCPSREHCYRYTAPTNPYRQSYMNFKPDESGKCADYVEDTREARKP